MPWPRRVTGDLAPVRARAQVCWRRGRSAPAAAVRRTGARRSEVRVLRAGVDGGLAGSGDVAARQREQAEALVRGHGRIVAEFFDAGQSRTVAWARRPQAAALVARWRTRAGGGTRS